MDTNAESTGAAADAGRGWRYAPHLVVFTSSACIMVIELVAGRLIARHLGNSLYVWTSIIGVVLAGISFGNVLGGRFADRWKPEAVLGWLFLSASASCVLILLLNALFSELRPLRGLPWALQTFASALVIFGLPAALLGTISPALAKMALSRSSNVGSTLGAFYAWGAVGSIAGTFLTGFWLIEFFGARGVVLVVAFSLALLAACFGPKRRIHVAWAAVVAIAFAFSRQVSLPPVKAHRVGERTPRLEQLRAQAHAKERTRG